MSEEPMVAAVVPSVVQPAVNQQVTWPVCKHFYVVELIC